MGVHFQNIARDDATVQRLATNALTNADRDHQFHFWPGASGRVYVHSVFNLVECPRLPPCVYLLARRSEDGRTILRIDQASAEAPSLNLAEVRHRGARLGANEVHVHLIATGQADRLQIVRDLQAGQFAEIAAEPTSERPVQLC
jgi:hypothetical protein